MNARSLLLNTRFYVITFSLILSVIIYIFFKVSIPDGVSQTVKLTESYGLLSIIYLYLVLLASPLTRTFNFLPLRGQYLHARRALGVSTFYFALLHTLFAFFGQLGGFSGLGFLDNKYLFAIGISFIALIILAYMALTSFDQIVKKMGFLRWKLTHRLVYLVGVLVLIHTVMLGTHFIDLTTWIPKLTALGLAFLLFLEAIRLDKSFSRKISFYPKIGLSLPLTCLLIGGGLVYLFFPSSGGGIASFDIHAQHIQLAKDALAQAQNSQTNSPTANSSLSILQGDKTRRFTVSFLHPDNVQPGQDTQLTFQVYDASSGNPIELYSYVYTKLLHLVIVDNELKYYAHIHPQQTDTGFTITTQFPHDGRYHLYLDFQPLGAIEQQIAFTLDVGNIQTLAVANQPVDTDLTKTFGNYQVTMLIPQVLKSNDMSVGNQTISFTIRDSKGNPVTTLKPYLAAYGHLVLINEKTYDYIHVHPSNLFPPSPNADGGPTVEFIPLGLYGPIKPGVYRVFAQFNPDNNLFTADFTIKVQ